DVCSSDLKGKIRQPIMPRQSLARQAQSAHVERLRISRINRRRQQQTRLAKGSHEFSAGSVNVAMIYRQMSLAPSLKLLRMRAMVIVEERPGEKRTISHGEFSCARSRKRPPLASRPSPPQGGRSAVADDPHTLRRNKSAKPKMPPPLPPCGGDGRPPRGG